MKRYHFTYSSEMESEGRMYEDVRKILSETGLDRRKINTIMVAISEAFTNALIHGNELNPAKSIELRLAINNKEIYADIIDEGKGFVAAEPGQAALDLLSEGGRGVGLMRTMADEIRFVRKEQGEGMVISLKFLRKADENDKNNKSYLEGQMDIQRTDAGNVIIINLSGRMDLNNGNRLKDEVKSILITGKTSIHLNLKNVEFVNSSGLGALVSIMKEVRIHRGRLTLSDMADYVREIFDITQLSHIFEIFPTEEDAMHSYQAVVPN
ncbi:hypothetical protein TRIP_C30043 [Candidatus Zixiibacteriota bacterium]|nr:hypothetical protein TRIP_C30043 [candidate division Zixibacteria bacterium]